MKRMMLSVVMPAALLLTGCVQQPKMLYQWEGYQAQVYEFFKGEGSTEEQIDELEKGLQLIRAKGNTPPPGYHAHLGMLYARLGRDDQVRQQFETEKTLFPESTRYIDFLMSRKELPNE